MSTLVYQTCLQCVYTGYIIIRYVEYKRTMCFSMLDFINCCTIYKLFTINFNVPMNAVYNTNMYSNILAFLLYTDVLYNVCCYGNNQVITQYNKHLVNTSSNIVLYALRRYLHMFHFLKNNLSHV